METPPGPRTVDCCRVVTKQQRTHTVIVKSRSLGQPLCGCCSAAVAESGSIHVAFLSARSTCDRRLARNPRAAAYSRTAASLHSKLSFNFKSKAWICAQPSSMLAHKSFIDANGSPAAEAMESDRNQS